MNKSMVFSSKLRSLQINERTDWEPIFGSFWCWAKNHIFWNEKHQHWDGMAFNILGFSVIYVLADEKVKQSVDNYISKVQELGTNLLEEMDK